ncbi:MAG: DUF2232 domain-containing protein [Pseudomonadota bacterium]
MNQLIISKKLLIKDILLTIFRIFFVQFVGLNFLIPLPFLMFGFRKESARSLQLIIFIAVAFIFYFLINSESYGLFLISFFFFGFLPSFLLLETIKRYSSFVRSLAVSLVILYVIFMGFQFIVMLFLNMSYDELISMSITRVLIDATSNANNNSVLVNSIKENISFLVKIAPSLIFAITAFILWLNLSIFYSVVCSKFDQRHSLISLIFLKFSENMEPKEKLFTEENLRNITYPDYMIWLVISCMFIFSLQWLLDIEFISRLGYNIVIFAAVIYFFQGLSICTFYIKKWKFSLFFRILSYIVMFLHYLIVILIGILDHWFDFRKIRKVKL